MLHFILSDHLNSRTAPLKLHLELGNVPLPFAKPVQEAVLDFLLGDMKHLAKGPIDALHAMALIEHEHRLARRLQNGLCKIA